MEEFTHENLTRGDIPGTESDAAADIHRSTPYDEQCTAVAASTDRGKTFMLLGAAGVTLAVLFLSRLLWLFKPLLDNIYYGTLSVIFYYIFVGVLFAAYIVALHFFLKKKCGERIFLPKKTHVSVTNTLAVIALGAAAMFVISACFKFKVKIQIEMGSGVTTAAALTNIAVYFYYALHLWLGLTAAALFDRAMSMLVPTKRLFPWGAILLVTVFGLTELALEFWTTDHLYPILYYALCYVYAAVYELTGRSYHLTYWACVAIMVL